jgi:hypothetical protein
MKFKLYKKSFLNISNIIFEIEANNFNEAVKLAYKKLDHIGTFGRYYLEDKNGVLQVLNSD